MIVIKYLHLLELFNNVRVLKSVVMKKLNEFCCRVGWGGADMEKLSMCLRPLVVM